MVLFSNDSEVNDYSFLENMPWLIRLNAILR